MSRNRRFYRLRKKEKNMAEILKPGSEKWDVA